MQYKCIRRCASFYILTIAQVYAVRTPMINWFSVIVRDVVESPMAEIKKIVYCREVRSSVACKPMN